jgi:uncharacterized protein (TIGR02118 family)
VRRVVVRIGMAPRAPSLGFEEFQEHWATGHGALAGTLDGLRSYVQNHAILIDGRPLLPYPGFDACSELTFDSLEAMDAAFDSEHYRTTVTADEQSLIDKSRFGLMLTDRRVLADGDPGAGAAKLLTFFVADRNSGLDELAEALAGPYRHAVAGASPLRHEQLVVLSGAHDNRRAAMADAVDLLWFPGPVEALAFLASDAAFAAGYTLAGRASGVQRLLARTIRVV